MGSGASWGGERREQSAAVSGPFHVNRTADSECTTSKWGTRAPEVEVDGLGSDDRIWMGRKEKRTTYSRRQILNAQPQNGVHEPGGQVDRLGDDGPAKDTHKYVAWNNDSTHC
ncbi:hypothetical protein BDZ89DRAFT_1046327 [Hymenopellis radicata]|nr:hypothetical protein BDZ89DRAFT_1046327 [Hymenopellis radicata]